MSAGRPKAESQARAELIRAARTLFARAPYSKVSIRTLAREAGVNSALISYYFNDKAGLFAAMLQETLAPLLHRFDQIPEEADRASLLALMQAHYRMAAQTPELPKLLMRLMMDHEAGPDHQAAQALIQRIDQKAQKVFLHLQQKGLIKDCIPRELARLSFVSLLMAPFLLPPRVLHMLGISLDPDFLQQLAAHNINLLYQGILTAALPATTEDSV